MINKIFAYFAISLILIANLGIGCKSQKQEVDETKTQVKIILSGFGQKNSVSRQAEEGPSYFVLVEVRAQDLANPLKFSIPNYILGTEQVIYVPSGLARIFEIWLYENYPASKNPNEFPANLYVTTTPETERTIDLVGTPVTLQIELGPSPTGFIATDEVNKTGYLLMDKEKIAPEPVPSGCELVFQATFHDQEWPEAVLGPIPFYLTQDANFGVYSISSVPSNRKYIMEVSNPVYGWSGTSSLFIVPQDGSEPVDVVLTGWEELLVSPQAALVEDGQTSSLVFSYTGGWGQGVLVSNEKQNIATVSNEDLEIYYKPVGPIGSNTVDSLVVTDVCDSATVTSKVFWEVPPFISKISPQVLFPSGGDTITVYGARFKPGAQIYFGETPLPTTFISPSELRFKTPPAPDGSYTITVKNPAGRSPSSSPSRRSSSRSPDELFTTYNKFFGVRYLDPNGQKVIVETEFNDSPIFCNLIEPSSVAGAGIPGSIDDPFDVDYYCVVAPLNNYGLSVFIEAMEHGSHLDAEIQLLTRDGRVLASNDDFVYFPPDPRVVVNRYSIIPGEIYIIRVASANRSTKHYELNTKCLEGGSYRLFVGHTTTFAGQITDPSGMPISDPNLELVVFRRNSFLFYDNPLYRNINGNYEAVIAPDDKINELWAYSPLSGIIGGDSVVILNGNETVIPTNVELLWGMTDCIPFSAEVRVFYANGEPAQYIPIHYYHYWNTLFSEYTITDSYGSFYINFLFVSGPGHGPIAIELPDLTTRYISIKDCSTASFYLGNLYLLPYPAISGTVLEGGTPAEFLQILAIDSKGNAVMNYTGNSYFSIVSPFLEPGMIRVWAYDSFLGYIGSNDTFLLNSNDHRDVGLTIGPAKEEADYISGTIYSYPGHNEAPGYQTELLNPFSTIDVWSSFYPSGYPDWSNGDYYLPSNFVTTPIPYGPYQVCYFDSYAYETSIMGYEYGHPLLSAPVCYTQYKWIDVTYDGVISNLELLFQGARCSDGYDNDGDKKIDYQPNSNISDDVMDRNLYAGACCYDPTTVIITPGPNGVLETVPRGDDDILNGMIVVGANGQVNTTVDGDPECEDEYGTMEGIMCDDGIDNDMDGFIDFQQCSAPSGGISRVKQGSGSSFPHSCQGIQLFPAGAYVGPNTVIIKPAQGGTLRTIPHGDDQLVDNTITAGPNGIVNTTVIGSPYCSSLNDLVERAPYPEGWGEGGEIIKASK